MGALRGSIAKYRVMPRSEGEKGRKECNARDGKYGEETQSTSAMQRYVPTQCQASRSRGCACSAACGRFRTERIREVRRPGPRSVRGRVGCMTCFRRALRVAFVARLGRLVAMLVRRDVFSGRIAEIGIRQCSICFNVVRQTGLRRLPWRLLGPLVRDVQRRVLRKGRGRENSQGRLIAYVRVGAIRNSFI